MDNLAIYCELKINDRKTGELQHIITGVYYADLNDFAECVRKGTIDDLQADIFACLIDNSEVIFDDNTMYGRLSLVCLENEFPEDYDEDN